MANAINSLNYGNNTYTFTLPYGSCSTAAATAAKTVTVDNFSLETGARVAVKFKVTNTAASPTLNVNSTGAKAIYYNGAAITAGYLKINKVYEFIYNGTQFDLVGDIDTGTTITGGASTIESSNLTASRALVSNSSGKVAVSAVTSTELGYLDGVTSNVQTQLNNKAASSHTHSYLPLSGGTISGILTVANEGSNANSGGIKMLNSSGTALKVMHVGNTNNLAIGSGLFNAATGSTTVYGGTKVDLIIPYNKTEYGVRVTTTGNSSYPISLQPNSSGKFYLGTSGAKWYQIYANTATVQTSDEREKENIVPLGVSPIMTLSLDDETTEQEQIDLHSELFDRLIPVQYNMIEGDGRICYGLIAQQVIEAMAELGIEENELDLVRHEYYIDEETGEEKDTYGVAYANMIGLLIHEVQKLKAEVETLKGNTTSEG